MTALVSSMKSEVMSSIKGDFICILLFGSYSRGDFSAASDVDIMQIAPVYGEPYSVGNKNYSIYTLDQINKMCLEGALFMLHIIKEGKQIHGNFDCISMMKKWFIKQDNYDKYKKDLLVTANMLDVDAGEYLKNWKGFNSLLCFLFRSYLYADLYNHNSLIFSVPKVVKHYNDSEIELPFFLKRSSTPDYKLYSKCLLVFERYSGTTFCNEYRSPRKYLEMLANKVKLTTALGLHFIKDAISAPDY